MDGKVKVKGHLDETKVVNNTFFSTCFSSSKQPHNFKDEFGCPKSRSGQEAHGPINVCAVSGWNFTKSSLEGGKTVS